MAGCFSKSKELLRLIPDLQCHNCKSVPGPNENQKNRYSCLNANGSHILCEEHKTKCLCGSKVGKSPSPFIAKFLQDLPWMCQNYKTGCREIKMNVEDLEHHQGNCIYRQVFCPFQSCQEFRLSFKDVFEHLETSHIDSLYDYGKKNALFVMYPTANSGLADGNRWAPVMFTSSCGATFFVSAKIVVDSVRFWVLFMGPSDEAKKYSSTISVTTNKIGEKFIFNGPVHIIDEGTEDIIASGSLLSVGVNVAQRSLNQEKHLKCDITIRNLKEEAKDDDMESGISD